MSTGFGLRGRAWCGLLIPTAILLLGAAPAPSRVRAPEAEAAFAQGRYAEAHMLASRALSRCAPTRRQPDRCLILAMTASSYALAAGDVQAAERLARQAVTVSDALAEGSGEQAMSRVTLASAYSGQGRVAEAEAETRDALARSSRSLGEGHVLTATIQNSLALLLTAQGRAVEAEPLHRMAIAGAQGALGARHPAAPTMMNSLADNLTAQARYREAATVQDEAVEMARSIHGPRHPATAIALSSLARLRQMVGAFDDAERLYREAAEINVAALGPEHALVGRDASNLGQLLLEQGRWAEAETQVRRALAIAEAASGPDHPAVATDLGDLASLLSQSGRPELGEPLFRRSLAIERATFGDDSPRMAAQLGALAGNLEDQRRAADAEPLRRRALEIVRTVQGEGHPDTASALAGLAGNVATQQRYDEARPLLVQAIAAQELAVGTDALPVASGLSQLGVVEARQGRLDVAEPTFRRALAIRKARLGEASPVTASAHHNLASVLELAGRLDLAEAPARQALSIRRAALPRGHPDIAVSEALLARILAGRPGNEALTHARAGMALVRARRLQASAAGDTAARAELLARGARTARDPADRVFSAFLLSADRAPDRDALASEAFLAAQDLDVSATALALAQTVARTAAGPGDLAGLARRQQDLSAAIRILDSKAIQALGQGLSEKSGALRVEIDAATQDLTRVNESLREKFPDYAALVSPRALSVADVQARLGPGEGLLFVTPADDDLYVFAIGRRRLAWRRIAGGVASVGAQVGRLRCSVDPLTCGDLAPVSAFDPMVALAVYQEVVRPVEPALAGARRLFVTTSGPLASLPLDALATSVPRSGDLAGVRWLGDRYAITSLPAVSAMRPRISNPGSRTARAFIGYGDPVFAGGGTGDLGRLRGMAPLPGTRQELDALAGAMGASPASLVMGTDATEPAVRKDTRLAEAGVIAFATHGLLPGELNGRNEPGLVFTPPLTASDDNDGLLGASEVSQMTFSADWVVLSACNTGSGEGGSDSLSALARAFLYAGAQALVASHWRVADDATAALTVEMLTAHRMNPHLSRAEARQRAMRAVRTGRRADGSAVAGWTPEWRDPTAWAPFTLIAASSD
ncbi:MAG: tetratricopeptide repeat protein [Phenylobacterium sp.]|nr:tetratricopeptide repeat protein [Phenylobacterium sp.]